MLNKIILLAVWQCWTIVVFPIHLIGFARCSRVNVFSKQKIIIKETTLPPAPSAPKGRLLHGVLLNQERRRAQGIADVFLTQPESTTTTTTNEGGKDDVGAFVDDEEDDDDEDCLVCRRVHRECPNNPTQIKSQTLIMTASGENLECLTNEELEELAEALKMSYNRLNAELCDPLFRRMTNTTITLMGKPLSTDHCAHRDDNNNHNSNNSSITRNNDNNRDLQTFVHYSIPASAYSTYLRPGTQKIYMIAETTFSCECYQQDFPPSDVFAFDGPPGSNPLLGGEKKKLSRKDVDMYSKTCMCNSLQPQQRRGPTMQEIQQEFNTEVKETLDIPIEVEATGEGCDPTPTNRLTTQLVLAARPTSNDVCLQDDQVNRLGELIISIYNGISALHCDPSFHMITGVGIAPPEAFVCGSDSGDNRVVDVSSSSMQETTVIIHKEVEVRGEIPKEEIIDGETPRMGIHNNNPYRSRRELSEKDGSSSTGSAGAGAGGADVVVQIVVDIEYDCKCDGSEPALVGTSISVDLGSDLGSINAGAYASTCVCAATETPEYRPPSVVELHRELHKAVAADDLLGAALAVDGISITF